ncbi:DUF4252 domain-containing protein [Aquimarina sp. 2201CG5-10]|uniref:DUF4252 domain-containing protein n=1 Tax=Aquimarina callyspongiae TaxID=3098150 RepID=UPI002AB5A4F1|nr:DUF4252 domain-containing protein [Aquimarina sp. 2201CG5-10]MDY8138899.1 DUF4252 domain-containing protein [Aquimarina sp. 2201CG5-10]
MKNVYKIIAIACVAILMSCNSEPSLQKYFVDHQDDAEFIAVDVASSLLDKDKMDLTDGEKEALKSIKKVNFLALPLKNSSSAKFNEESTAIDKILSSEKYETLMRFGSDGTKAVLKYQGNDNEIDEVIVFATDQEKGLLLARLLGDNMKPENMAQLAKAIDKGDLNLDAFKKMADAFDED